MICNKQDIIDALKKIYDPEIPVNIWDMGLIYDIDLGNDSIVIKMEELLAQVHEAVQSVCADMSVRVDLVWDPPWDLSRMSDEARLELDLTNQGW